MHLEKRHRMSKPVVIIGYLFLVPAIVGMLIGLVITIGGIGAAADGVSKSEAQAEQPMSLLGSADRNLLDLANVDNALVDRLDRGETIAEEELRALPTDQRRAVRMAQTSADLERVVSDGSAKAAGGALEAAFGVMVILGAFVNGLLGWLLVMKKRVLACDTCEAVVAAS